jgi:hypothetical protein
MRLSIFPLQSAYKVDKSITSKEGTAQEKDAVPGVDDSEKPVSGSSTQSSSSSSSGSSEPMEAADEGRKAEDIPAKEIEDSLHQAEVRFPPVISPRIQLIDHLILSVVRRRSSSRNEHRIQGRG